MLVDGGAAGCFFSHSVLMTALPTDSPFLLCCHCLTCWRLSLHSYYNIHPFRLLYVLIIHNNLLFPFTKLHMSPCCPVWCQVQDVSSFLAVALLHLWTCLLLFLLFIQHWAILCWPCKTFYYLKACLTAAVNNVIWKPRINSCLVLILGFLLILGSDQIRGKICSIQPGPM